MDTVVKVARVCEKKYEKKARPNIHEVTWRLRKKKK